MGSTMVSAAVLALIVLSGVITGQPTPTQTHRYIDPSTVLVEEWEGWGTGLAWWADVVGGMEEEVMDYITNLVFGTDELNFNIVRYAIGATTPRDVVPFPCGDYRPGAATESYKDGTAKAFDWTRDPRQRLILDKAISLGANVFEAYSASPPQWLTTTGCAKGNSGGGWLRENFAGSAAEEFADYASEVIQHFHDIWNVTFEYYAPFNEPSGTWGFGGWDGFNNPQEGCNMNRNTMAAVVSAVHNSFVSKGMDYVSITAADEEESITGVETSWFFGDSGYNEVITKLNIHGYGNSGIPDYLNRAAHTANQKLWMSAMEYRATPLGNMLQAINIGQTILYDVRNMQNSAWVYGQVVEDREEWGLLSIPLRASATIEDIEYNSGFYGMMQFSKYIKAGYQIVYVNDPNTLAAFHPETGTLVVVVVHESDVKFEKYYDISHFSGSPTIVSATRTSPDENHVVIPPQNVSLEAVQGTTMLRIYVAPHSITTVVLDNLTYDPATDVFGDLIINGDFEVTNDTDADRGWEIDGYGTLFHETWLWRGKQHGHFVQYLEGIDTTLTQTLTIPDDGSGNKEGLAYLTMHVGNYGFDTRLQVFVEGERVDQLNIFPFSSYILYGTKFHCKMGDTVKIQIRLKGNDYGDVDVDNVALHFIKL